MANNHPNSLPPPSFRRIRSQTWPQENDDDIDLEELIASLPKEKGFISPIQILYRNFWCPSEVFPGVHSFCRHFTAHDSDIILACKPKSGTTWLKALAFSALRRDVFPPSANNHPLMSSNPHELVPFFEFTIYGQAGELIDLASFSVPRLFATHIPHDSLPESVGQSGCRVIYICRNPLDTIVSFCHFAPQVKPELWSGGRSSMEEYLDYCCRGIDGFGPFWDHMLGYWKASLERPDKVLFLKYEDLREDTAGNLKRIAEFMGVPFSEEEERDGVIEEIVKLCSLSSLKELEVNKTGKPGVWSTENKTYFRKGEVGDWVNHMTPSMAEKLERIMEEKLSPFGLKFRVK
ncbi:cytosolic sulfotransferase 15-like isoform X1 [Punica granatum]|uniref:Sulfotransferase n=1 Tax=Punica granatum TaxID=22663 RepID=A0A218XZ16_PUNGR|nr:cytosolic sulfotransferase 15-like isoform X1 [Punica granatum]XP_031371834.1 cytosolic sulfotransferase 15-like isoform X1 [Punica granatum]OWM90060.1 hypothetical protein CDL15_Pgr026973 [Punica granatum]